MSNNAHESKFLLQPMMLRTGADRFSAADVPMVVREPTTGQNRERKRGGSKNSLQIIGQMAKPFFHVYRTGFLSTVTAETFRGVRFFSGVT